MRFGLGVAAVLGCCVMAAGAQTATIPSASNPGDAKEVPGRAHPDGKGVPASAVAAGASGQANAAGLIDPAKTMDAMLSGVEKDVVALAEAMPAEKYAFQPKASDFTGGLIPNYDGVRTFGQEIAHVAVGNYGYASMGLGVKPQVDLGTVGKGVDKETAVASLKASFAAFHQAVGALTVANAFQHAGRGPSDTMISTLATGMAHDRDHYGQLVEYARMNGIVPPASVGRPAANPAPAK